MLETTVTHELLYVVHQGLDDSENALVNKRPCWARKRPTNSRPFSEYVSDVQLLYMYRLLKSEISQYYLLALKSFYLEVDHAEVMEPHHVKVFHRAA